jgi:hypothetical protein
MYIVLATGPGNWPANWYQTVTTVQFSSNLVQKPDPLHPGGPNQNPDLSTCMVSAFGLSGRCQSLVPVVGYFYLWSHSDILLLIGKY